MQAILAKLGLLQYLPRFVERGFDMMAAVRLMDESDMCQECGMSPEHAQMLQSELSRSVAPAAGERQRSRSPRPSFPKPSLASGGAAPPTGGLPAAFAKPLTAAGLPRLEGTADLPRAFARSPDDSGPPRPPELPMLAALPGDSTAGGRGELAAAMPPEGQGEGQGSQAYAQFYALAQLAEESAQMNASAAAFCASPSADPLQIAMVSEAAQQAAQRAAWAVSSMAALEEQKQQAPKEGEEETATAEWRGTMRSIARQAADAADQAAQSCKARAEAVGGTNLQAMLGPRKSKVPCKNHLAGHCMKGMSCEFSHDPADLQARPLMLKSMKPCMFFAKGHCMRGPACPFAHGEEERAEIEKYVDQLKKEKKQLGGGFRRM